MTDPADLPGRGLQNVRDLGGLPTVGGGRLRAGRLFRSDAPVVGDPPPPVRPWPPATVIDLREPGEGRSTTHPLVGHRTRIVSVPLMPELDPTNLAERSDVGLEDIPTIYRGVMRSAAHPLAHVVGVIAESAAPVLIHCAAGKDRTGIAVAVTLAAVGVRPEAIVADYVRTEQHLDGLPDRLAQAWSDDKRRRSMHLITVERPDLMRAPAEAIEGVLDALAAWPGGPSGWLLDHGLAAEALETLRRELTEPA